MTMSKVFKLNQHLGRLCAEEKYTNNDHIDLALSCENLISAYLLIGSGADFDTLGEYTRRFEASMKDFQSQFKKLSQEEKGLRF